MNKSTVRACSICGNTEAELLHSQEFVLPAGHPLSSGYDVVCCHKCGFVYADTFVRQVEYDLFYAMYSKYEDKKTASGGESPSDRNRFEETAYFISSFLPDKNARILDIGCANGGLLKSLKKIGYYNLLGIDPSPVCVENVRRCGIAARIGSLSASLNFGIFDCILMSHVLEHVNNLVDVMTAIHQSILDSPGKQHKTLIYIEVPNASQYQNYIFAPLQDFNTEHINHFSKKCIENLMRVNGFSIVSEGEKEIESSPGMPYPTIYSLSVINDFDSKQFRIIKDDELIVNIKHYIAKSKTLLHKIDHKIKQILSVSDRLIVWGTGQLTMKLLADTSLAKANIVAFVDNNSINQGRMLNGISIVSPQKIVNLQFPILVATLFHQKAIAEQIKSLSISNLVFFLDKHAE
jgi:SAM-dependent methyltransferase